MCSAQTDAFYPEPEIDGLTVEIEHRTGLGHAVTAVTEDGTRGRTWTVSKGMSEIPIRVDELRED